MKEDQGIFRIKLTKSEALSQDHVALRRPQKLLWDSSPPFSTPSQDHPHFGSSDPLPESPWSLWSTCSVPRSPKHTHFPLTVKPVLTGSVLPCTGAVAIVSQQLVSPTLSDQLTGLGVTWLPHTVSTLGPWASAARPPLSPTSSQPRDWPCLLGHQTLHSAPPPVCSQPACLPARCLTALLPQHG
jgi:hypothetical protein